MMGSTLFDGRMWDVLTESKNFYAFDRLRIKCVRPIFKNKMLIHQLKAKLDEKVLFVKIGHLQDSINRKMPVRTLYWNQKFHVPFWPMIYVALKFTLSASEIEF